MKEEVLNIGKKWIDFGILCCMSRVCNHMQLQNACYIFLGFVDSCYCGLSRHILITTRIIFA
jgi:hypothetical protein